MFTTSALKEISVWKLDSKFEDMDRYFYHLDLVDELSNGNKFYVIGRKGTGKTAISKYLESTDFYDHFNAKNANVNLFTDKLTFKSFPFNDLYSLKDTTFRNNQYITIWKFVIYSSICKMMIQSDNTPPMIKTDLEKIFHKDVSIALKRNLHSLLEANFNLKIFGGGLKSSITENNSSWIEKVDILEKFISENYYSNDEFIIMFDELDEDYQVITNQANFEQYQNLLTGLFKAVQDVRSLFSTQKIYPIIFLRDDIYDILQDSDKSKWRDFAEELNWDSNSIKKLLAFRISRAIDPDINLDDIQDFNSIWKQFAVPHIKAGNRASKKINSFEFIERKTLLRPRDFIKYLQQCAKLALEEQNATLISSTVIKKAGASFSNHLKDEFIDEIGSIIPDIREILEIFREIRKQTLSIEEFELIFKEKVANHQIKTTTFSFVMQTLFYFSVIGNQPRQKTYQSFKFRDKNASLNHKENIIVHQGLFRALQIL